MHEVNLNNCKQVTKEQDSNWNIYQDEKGIFHSIAIKPGCQNSYFGDLKHIVSLIYNYKSFKKEDFTEYGYSLIMEYLNKRGYTENDLFNRQI